MRLRFPIRPVQYDKIRKKNVLQPLQRKFCIPLKRRLPRKNKKCPKCRFYTLPKLMPAHLKDEHNIIPEVETLKFTKIRSFEHWKRGIEISTYSKFVITKSKHNRTMYQCIKCLSFGHNSLKCLFCLASIRLIRKSKNIYKVRYIKTHINHSTSRKAPRTPTNYNN